MVHASKLGNSYSSEPQGVAKRLKTGSDEMATTMKSSRFALSFQRISQHGSASFFLWRFKLAHMYIQVTSLHKGQTRESICKFLYRKSISCLTLISSVLKCAIKCFQVKCWKAKEHWKQNSKLKSPNENTSSNKQKIGDIFSTIAFTATIILSHASYWTMHRTIYARNNMLLLLRAFIECTSKISNQPLGSTLN